MIQNEFLVRTETLLISAIGLAAALAWNEAVKVLFQEIFGPGDNILALFMYAMVVTAIAIFAIIWLQHVFKKIK
tara:strand:- start:5547 stop:5768 length:222 start_codon:yes stop_codon:yes gene_type:complete